MDKNGIRAGQGAGHSVGKSVRTATEITRQARTAQAARKAANARLLAAVHELRAAFEARYTFDGVVTIWVDPCCLGATYCDGSAGGLLEYHPCDPWGRRL